MPRVNRDLDKRMAARKDRRRVSGQRQYRFGPSGATAEVETTHGEAGIGGGSLAQPTRKPPTRSAPAGIGAATPAFATFSNEYRYLWTDLRRVAAVVGSILVALVVLSFLLPR